MKKKNRVVTAICMVILALAYLGLLIIPSISDISGKDDNEYNVVAVYTGVEYTKKMNYIPFAKSTYYVCVTDDLTVITVRESSKWYDKNFTDDGIVKSGDGIKISGKESKMPVKVQDELESSYSELRLYGYEDITSRTEFIDNMGYRLAIRGIITAVVSVAVAVLGIIGAKKGGWFNKPAVIAVYGIIAIAVILFGVHVILIR